jgi:hypothetical protein
VTEPLPETKAYLDDWVREDSETVDHILTVGTSSATGKPINLMLKGGTSLGKSYPVTKILSLFPNAVMLGGATPKNFFYENGPKVDEYGKPIDARLEEIEDRLAGLTGKLKAEQDLEKSALQREKAHLLRNSRILLDFTGKIYAVLDTVPQEVWDALKSALAHDSYEHEYRTVVDGRQRVVLVRGWPCIIYATAGNEEKRKSWDQTRSRFVITTPSANQRKYQAANELTGDLYGLPSVALRMMYPEEKRKRAKAEIAGVLNTIFSLRRNAESDEGDPTDNIVFNPFSEYLNEKFPHKAGTDMRNYRYFLQYVDISALMSAGQRYKLMVDGKTIAVVANWDDVARAVRLIGKDLTPLTEEKNIWYKTKVVPMWASRVQASRDATKKMLTMSNQVKLVEPTAGQVEKKLVVTSPFTVSDLVDWVRENENESLGRDSVRDTYMSLYVDVGLLEEANPDRKGNQPIEYRPAMSADQEARYMSGFDVGVQPGHEIADGAIIRLTQVLRSKAPGNSARPSPTLTWILNGEEVIEPSGEAFLSLSSSPSLPSPSSSIRSEGGVHPAVFEHAQNQPIQANQGESMASDLNPALLALLATTPNGRSPGDESIPGQEFIKEVRHVRGGKAQVYCNACNVGVYNHPGPWLAHVNGHQHPKEADKSISVSGAGP